jgi:hypothetical protein
MASRTTPVSVRRADGIDGDGRLRDFERECAREPDDAVLRRAVRRAIRAAAKARRARDVDDAARFAASIAGMAARVQ